LVRKKVLAIAIVAFVVIVSVALVYWWCETYQPDRLKHETDQWAIISDSHNDVIALETNSADVWNELENLEQNQTELWIGGIIEEYDNYWGFRFNPDTIVLAEVTAEGAQATIQFISDDLDYWMNTWDNVAYVSATVEKTHEP